MRVFLSIFRHVLATHSYKSMRNRPMLGENPVLSPGFVCPFVRSSHLAGALYKPKLYIYPNSTDETNKAKILMKAMSFLPQKKRTENKSFFH